MARIAYVSPVPPARTGIATYSAQVLASLRRGGIAQRHELDVVWPLGPRTDERIRTADVAVYHVGNNAEFHGEIYRAAVRTPGLVVLHDLAIDDLARWFLDAGSPVGMRAAREAEAARVALYEARPDIGEPLDVPWCAHLVRRSRGVIVHSPFGREYLEGFGSRTPVFVVPHEVIEPPRAARGAARRAASIRERLGDVFLVGVLGDIGAPKGIEAVLEAAASVERAHVAIVGRRVPGFDVEAAAAGDRVTVAADVSEEDFYAWLHASDVIVNLRYPHRGEVSGTLIRAMAAGKPAIVQEVGTYLDWPEDSVIRVSAGPPDAAELREHLVRLAADPEAGRRVGDRAAEEITRLREERAAARGYEEAIEATLALVRAPRRSAAARWAGALAQLGGTEEHASYGVRYLRSLEEVTDGPGVRWAGSAGRFG